MASSPSSRHVCIVYLFVGTLIFPGGLSGGKELGREQRRWGWEGKKGVF